MDHCFVSEICLLFKSLNTEISPVKIKTTRKLLMTCRCYGDGASPLSVSSPNLCLLKPHSLLLQRRPGIPSIETLDITLKKKQKKDNATWVDELLPQMHNLNKYVCACLIL